MATSPKRNKTTARAKAKAPAIVKPKRPLTIDFHAHIAVPEVLDFAYQHSQFAKAVAKRRGRKAAPVPRQRLIRMMDPKLRIKDMDAMGIDIQVLSPSILQQCTYWAEPRKSLRVERIGNDRVAEAVAENPDRLVGLGALPLQSVPLAVKELERAVTRLGLKGVIISSNVRGLDIGDKKLWPFWKKAEQLGAAILIHPAGSVDERMKKHLLLITLGQPLEEAFAQSSLVYEGVMDRFPKLKIVISHGGGYLPYYTGRHDNAYRQGAAGARLKGNFSHYLKKFYYETVLFNPDMLEFLATKVNTSHIMMGSDYPFGEWKPVEFVRRAKKISRAAQDGILGRNAAKILGIRV